MIMKKMIPLLLIIALYAQGITAFAQIRYIDVSQNPFEEDIYELSLLGVASGYEDGTFQPNVPLTRSEFCRMIFPIFNINISVGQSYFKDVERGHPAFNEINLLANRGYISGYADSTFRPYENIEANEAAAILINILGYRYLAVTSGGYPSGYIRESNKLGLAKGISLKNDALLKRGEACRLINNALDIPLAELAGVGDSNTYRIDEEVTLLTKYMKMKRGEGLVTANDLVSIHNKDKAPKDAIIADGIAIKITADSDRALVGYNIKYIIRIDDDMNIKEAVSLKKGENTELTVDRDDLISFKGTEFKYLIQNEREKSIRLSLTADIILNGEYLGYEETMFEDVEYGSFTFLSTKNNSVYDIVIINSYTQISVAAVSKTNYTIVDKFTVLDENGQNIQRVLNLDPDKRSVAIFSREGDLTNFDAISVNSVILVKDSPGTAEIYLGTGSRAGILEEMSEDGEVVISGERYLLNPYVNKESVNPGETVEFALDFFGRVSYLKKAVDSENKLLYLIKLSEYTAGFENGVIGKFYDFDSSFKSIMISDRLTLNGENIQDITLNDLFDRLKYSAVRKIDGVNTTVDTVCQIVKVGYSEDGKINELEASKTIEDLGDGDGLCTLKPLTNMRYLTNVWSFSMNVYFTSTTPILFLPDNPEEAQEREFRMGNASNLTDLAYYDVEAHAYSKEAEEADFLIVKSSAADAVKERTLIGVIKYVTLAVNSDGETVKRIHYVTREGEQYADYSQEDGASVKYSYLGTEVKLNQLACGDTVTFGFDSINRIKAFVLYVKYDDRRNRDNSSYGANDRVIVRDVKNITGNYVTVENPPSANEKYKVSAMTHKVLVVGGNNGAISIKEGDNADLDIGNKVVLQLFWRSINTIVVYK